MTVGYGPFFTRFIGIDYSGASTPDKGLPGLRAYVAAPEREPTEALPSPGRSKYWTRRGLAHWLAGRLAENRPTLVGVDHGFSFPLRYFEATGAPTAWPAFLDDFQAHWPTDRPGIWVRDVLSGRVGLGADRSGQTRWRRECEARTRAKSVFHFGVQGEVATSTHAGLPWLRFLRSTLGGQVHFWPFDGWAVPRGKSVVAEVYPSLWSRSFPRQGRTQDQHDAYSVAAWLRDADAAGRLAECFEPRLTAQERSIADIEGWILGLLA